MKKFVTVYFLVLAIVLTGLPITVSSQTSASGPGTSAYYSDDSVVRTATSQVRIKRLGWIHVGGNPQVKGGLYNTAPAADEEDVELDREITIMTMSASRVLYIGQLPTVLDNGAKVIVRRKKVSRKIIAIVNCGNYSRQVGAEAEVVLDKQVDIRYEKCKPNPDGMQKVSDTVNGDTRTEVYSDGCKTETTHTITRTNTITNNVCVPGSWIEVVRQGNDQGKVSGSKFKAADVVPASILDQLYANAPALRDKKVKFLQVLQGACEAERDKIKVIWFTGDGGGWNWVSFLVGAGVGFVAGFLVRGTPDCPVPVSLAPVKSHTTVSTNPGGPRPNIVPQLGGTTTVPTTTSGTRRRRIP